MDSAFANGEGCFTASLMCYLKGMWGLQPQGELNITQKVEDLPLLEAIDAFLDIAKLCSDLNGIILIK